MSNIDFQEIALSCKKQAEAKYIGKEDKFEDTLFVAISDDNKVLTSYTPHILNDATFYMLIHRHKCLAQTRFYDWYDVECIDKYGCVTINTINDEYQLKIDCEGKFSNQVIKLLKNDKLIYKCRFSAPDGDYQKQLQIIWDLYNKCTKCGSTEEAILLGKLAMQDEQIIKIKAELADKTYSALLLEKERDQYKELLDTIKTMVEK